MNSLLSRFVFVSSICLAPMAAGCVGCNPPVVTHADVNSAIVKAQSFASTAQTVISNVQIAWTFVKPFVPADKIVSVETQFNKAVISANGAVAALNDAIAVAVAVNSATPDFNAAYASVNDAVNKVLAVVNEWTAPSGSVLAAGSKPLAPADVPGLAAARAGAESLKAVK